MVSRRESAEIPAAYDPIIAGTRDGSGSVVHDKALLHACNANFKPPSFETDPKRTVFVGRLPLSATENDVRLVFSECGELRNIRLVRHVVTGESRGYAFVTFKHSASVKQALKLHDSLMSGRRILVQMEVGRVLSDWKPRRLGGGFGGRKESGQMRFGGRDCPHSARAGPSKPPSDYNEWNKHRGRC